MFLSSYQAKNNIASLGKVENIFVNQDFSPTHSPTPTRVLKTPPYSHHTHRSIFVLPDYINTEVWPDSYVYNLYTYLHIWPTLTLSLPQSMTCLFCCYLLHKFLSLKKSLRAMYNTLYKARHQDFIYPSWAKFFFFASSHFVHRRVDYDVHCVLVFVRSLWYSFRKW